MSCITEEMKNAPTPQGSVVDAVRSSCRSFTEKGPVKVSQQGIQGFLAKLDKLQYQELAYDSTMKMPLKFDTVAEEMNFITFVDLLNFGSGYRVLLHELADRGAFDTIRFGAMSLHIGGKALDAETFKNMTVFEVAEVFQFPIDREVKHEKLDFVTLTEPTPLRPFADGLADALNTTAEYLIANNYKDFFQFIMAHVEKHPQDAKSLVDHFAKNLPCLFDKYLFNNEPVYLYKKAQIIVYHLWFTFKEQLPQYFDFKDIDQLTIFADNVIPTLLTHLKIIEIPQAWQEQIERNIDLSVEQATALRAASVTACEDIVKSDSNLTTGGLDVYFWRLGKVGDFRKITRFSLKNTIMF